MSRAATIVQAVREAYHRPDGFLPLHAPIFEGNESAYVLKTIESTFVSSVGEYVSQFERMLQDITGAAHVVATTNGTTALHMSLLLAGVERDDLVVTQSLSFVATANSIAHAGAVPAFVDVDADTLGMSPTALDAFLERECERSSRGCVHRGSGRRVAACVPMHSFGLPARIQEIADVCRKWSIPLIEDAAEALGSRVGAAHCGTFGLLGTLSFNGNKICTTGGGGAIMTNDPEIAKRAKHLTTTAKVPHRWRFEHDAIGYNFRLPNLNAALGCAQLERLDKFIEFKRDLVNRYVHAFAGTGIQVMTERPGTYSNYWLCAILLADRDERDACLEATNEAGVMTRPVWEPLHTLPMFADAPHGPLETTQSIADRLINIPSGVLHPSA
ncbi:aminotransferase DegT [Trinickia dabaoshanensis]|uniref:Aminotransferase DegT n=1 Tax=Trinickia dabaoshanensis TaxID=564714 RepID=A0A2N7VFE2_9BURK|nr:LegC family aminotransferase [Trinickia dabaoshanensis]PMS15866.1 aminotransferase DegT [Trinickia dabaoshanensis]